MREMFKHRPGKVFLLFLLLSVIALLYVPKFFFEQHLFFGFMTAPFLAGTIFLLLWLIAYLIYFFFFWPYRH